VFLSLVLCGKISSNSDVCDDTVLYVLGGESSPLLRWTGLVHYVTRWDLCPEEGTDKCTLVGSQSWSVLWILFSAWQGCGQRMFIYVGEAPICPVSEFDLLGFGASGVGEPLVISP